MLRFSALETQISVGVQTNEVTRLLVHIVGVHQNALLKVTSKNFVQECRLQGLRSNIVMQQPFALRSIVICLKKDLNGFGFKILVQRYH